MANDIPDWAIEKANGLSCTYNTVECTRRNPDFQWARITLAFARYISQHEPAPVDPLRAEAIDLVCGESIARTDNQIAAIRSGQAGQDKVALTMRALKRGMELAREGGAK